MMEKSAAEDKKIQITMLTFSITAASTIITLIFTSRFLIGNTPNYSELNLALPLIPLLFLLPCWAYYFDSAITIVRKISYCRVLEKLLSKPNELETFLGYERGVKYYGKYEHGYLEKSKNSSLYPHEQLWKILEIFLLSNYHRNWTIVYYTYFASAATCIIISYKQIASGETPLVFLRKCTSFDFHLFWLIFLISAIFVAGISFRWIIQLNLTKHSYDVKEKIWTSIFEQEL